MKDIVICKTANNYYIYSFCSRRIFSIDKLSYQLIKILKDTKSTIENAPTQHLANLLNVSASIINDHLTLLHNICGDTEKIKKIKAEITSGSIYYNLSNNPQLSLEVTECCNLHCTYCCYGNLYNTADTARTSSMSTDIAQRAIDTLIRFCNSKYSIRNHNTINVSFYGGEPLLNFRLIKEIVDYCSKKTNSKIDFSYSMTTNALLLRTYIDFLAQNKFSLLISLDGNEYNNSYRKKTTGEGSFSEVFSNLIFIRNNFPTYFKDKIQFNCVLHDRNCDIESLLNFFDENFDKRPGISELSLSDIKPSKKDYVKSIFRSAEKYLTAGQKYNEEDIPLIYRNCFHFISNHTDYKYDSVNDFYCEDKEQIATGTCIPYGRKVFLTAHGKVYPCENISRAFQFGNIDNFFQSEQVESVVQTHNKLLKKTSELCLSCYNQYNCPQCMYNINWDNSSSICDLYMTEDDFSKELSSVMQQIEMIPSLYRTILKTPIE